MKKTLFITGSLLLLAGGLLAATSKAIKATRVNDYQVLVSCTNGRAPSTANVSGSLVVSCEGRQE